MDQSVTRCHYAPLTLIYTYTVSFAGHNDAGATAGRGSHEVLDSAVSMPGPTFDVRQTLRTLTPQGRSNNNLRGGPESQIGLCGLADSNGDLGGS